MTKARTIGAVEREKEREPHFTQQPNYTQVTL